MSPSTQRISSHYTHGDLSAAIHRHLHEGGSDFASLSPDSISSIDELHVGGRAGTELFAAQFRPLIGSRLLDVGSGLGGPARYLAKQSNCRITGIDATEEFVTVASDLTDRVDLTHRIEFRHGDATDLPFGEASFDGAYIIHAGMNIADKTQLFDELRRVIRSGGVLGIYDIVRGSGAEPLYPVPWATTADESFLSTPLELRAMLARAGFYIELDADRTAFGSDHFERAAKQRADGSPPPLTPTLLFGDSLEERMSNLARNVREGRCVPWTLVCRG